jgi:SAM-dependent methyltransferase
MVEQLSKYVEILHRGAAARRLPARLPVRKEPSGGEHVARPNECLGSINPGGAMLNDRKFDESNDAKASMDHIYDRADPRAYFRELKSVSYTIPGAARPILQKLIALLRRNARDTVRVLDIGCSYGINAALLKYDLTIEDLYVRWGQMTPALITAEEIIKQDREFFAGLERVEGIEVMGLDVAGNAIAFAEQAGLLDRGLALDLENQSLPEAAVADLAPVDLVTSTGCVGYVTEKSFERLLPALTEGRQPWFANFVLRMFPFDAIEETLGESGFVTEKLDGQTFIQRAFASDEERERILEQLIERGVDPTGEETEGNLVAEFFLSRPREDAARIPLDRLLSA